MDELTVVIPTYNRCETLRKSISAYFDQTALAAIREILVVDDGSTDLTQSMVKELSRNCPVPLRYIRKENRGPAAARNVGIREAKTKLLLFTDDDIVPSRSLVGQHLEWHRRFPQLSAAVLGYVTWSPEVNPTPFMQWYGSVALFEYARLEGKVEVSCNYLYTCNVSMKTDFLRRHGLFDEDFRVAAYEDIELGYRLGKAGMRLFYNRDALAYHRQYISFEDACKRREKAALGRDVYKRKEAWQYFHKSPSLKQRFVSVAAKWSGPVLSPFKTFMDSRLPLPSGLYRMMFRVFQ
jgi:glycosyltransferase involved in cell wall biosynthesis